MRKLFILIAILTFAEFGMAQTYTEGSGITGVDKLGAHQNGGRGCVGCHAPHSGARGNGGNVNGPNVSDPNTGDFALWGQDLGPLYGKSLAFGDDGSFVIGLPATSAGLGSADEAELTGVMTCLSCHDGNIAQGAMMTNQSYEQARGLLPAGYGGYRIPTLLGNDGTAAGNYHNDHPIGPNANLNALGSTGIKTRLLYQANGCGTAPNTYDCLIPDMSKLDMGYFYQHYGAFNISSKATIGGIAYNSGGRGSPLVLTGSVGTAFVVCTTCHTPHTMYTFSGNVRGSATSGVYPTYFFIAAPYNPGAPVTDATKASSATQFCRQCHFTGAGGSNEGSGIYTVDTQF